MKSTVGIFCMLWLTACASTAPAPENTGAPSPPWDRSSITRGEVRAVTLQEWALAGNRATCAPLGFSSLGAGEGGVPRRANFSGGWAVAFDRAGSPGVHANGEYCETCGRGTFGIAGTGGDIDERSDPPGSDRKMWSDGSSASLFLQGGSGPGHLAYLEVEGERCLYNVWTYLGIDHLSELLENLRYVE